MKAIKTIIFFIIFSVFVFTQDLGAKTDVARADSAYAAGQYEEAVTLYSEAAQDSGVSSELLFNLGNAACRAGDYGKAVLAYSRAKRLDPSDKVIAENLAYVSNKVEDANRAELKGKKATVVADDVSFFRRLYLLVAAGHASNVWAIWGAVCFILAIGCAAVYIFIPGVTLRKIGFFGGFVFLGVSLLLVCFSFLAASYVNSDSQAVMTDYKSALLSRPDEGAKASSAPLTRGTLLEVLETESDSDGNPAWIHVRLNSDYSGWLRASQAEII